MELYCVRLSKNTRYVSVYALTSNISIDWSDMTRAQRISNPRAIRQRLGMNQQDFWGQIGVTQSGGSRYESGREMPKPVQELLRVVHVERLNLRNVNRNDLMAANRETAKVTGIAYMLDALDDKAMAVLRA